MGAKWWQGETLHGLLGQSQEGCSRKILGAQIQVIENGEEEMNWPVGFEDGLMPGGIPGLLQRVNFLYADKPWLAISIGAISATIILFLLSKIYFRYLHYRITECA